MPDKAAFMSADGTALCTVADGETATLNPLITINHKVREKKLHFIQP